MISDRVNSLVLEYAKNMASSKRNFLRGLKEIENSDSISYEDKAYALRSLNPAHIVTGMSPEIRRYSAGASFKVLLSNYILEKSFYSKYKNSLAPGTNNKMADARFVKDLGFLVPEVYHENAAIDDIFEYDGCVVKSKNGASSKGVFVKNGNEFYHLFDKKVYATDAFLNYSKKQGFRRFIVEEYVGGEEAVRDLKFYMFYGEIGVVLEVKRNQSGNQHCFYDSDSRLVKTGRYRETEFVGSGFETEVGECAKKISECIPSPFIRVDLIVSEKGYRVGELTAHPGGYENFSGVWDTFLGEKFIKARARLLEDMLSGKEFDKYLKRLRGRS